MFPSTNPVSLVGSVPMCPHKMAGSTVNPPCFLRFSSDIWINTSLPSGYVKIAIENGNLYLIYPLNMVIVP